MVLNRGRIQNGRELCRSLEMPLTPGPQFTPAYALSKHIDWSSEAKDEPRVDRESPRNVVRIRSCFTSSGDNKPRDAGRPKVLS